MTAFGLATVGSQPRSHPFLPWPAAWVPTVASREAGAAAPTALLTSVSERSTACYASSPQRVSGIAYLAVESARPGGPAFSQRSGSAAAAHMHTEKGVSAMP